MASSVIRPLDRAGDLGWVVMAHGELYAREYDWDTDFEALVARIVAGFTEAHDPSRSAAWVAEVDGERVGCVFVVPTDRPDVAQLRLLLVDPKVRGAGIGRSLVRTCLDFARAAGYRTVTLWTNDVLAAARHLYQEAGFELVSSEPHHSFGHDLVSQTWQLDLA
jgi:N-acetylglutamate synthase-like GNAT family acetyltransferase